MEKLLTVGDLADALGVPVKTVYAWNSAGTGPKAIKCGKYVRFRPRDVDAWLDRQTAGSR